MAVSGRGQRVWVLLATLASLTALGAAVRLAPVIGASFPLNDGGLFVRMIEGVRDHGYGVPEYVEYNGLQIPFAYPPAGFYLGALWADVSGASIIDGLRLLPVAFSIATIPLAYAVFLPLLGTNARAAVATAGFAIMPRSYNWLISGGGITRSLGFLLAVATVAAGIRMFRSPHRLRWAAVTGIALGGSALSHPQAVVFAGISLVVLLPFVASSRRGAAMRLLGAVLVASLVVSPWVGSAIARHGMETLLGAAQTGGGVGVGLANLLTFRFSDGLVELLGILSAFGLFVAVVNRQWLYPIWAAAAVLIGSRAGLTYAMLPLGGALALAVEDLLRMLRVPAPAHVRDLVSTRRGAILVAILLVGGVADSVASRNSPWSPLHALSADQRAAMDWARSNSPADARFLLVTGESWALDAVSEWFPVLGDRRSLATVQGWEWLGLGKFAEQERRSQWLLNCAALTDQDCAAEWSSVVEAVDYVLVASGAAAAASGHPCCLQLAERLVASGHELVFRAGDVRIVRVDD